MEAPLEKNSTRTVVIVVVVLAVVMLLGIAVVKHGSKSAPETMQNRQEKLDGLERSSGVTSKQAKDFIGHEQEQRHDKSALDDMVSGQGQGAGQ
jgi:hypothetical protein